MGTAWAFRITGIIVFSVNTLAMLLIRDRDKQINPTNRSFDIVLLQRYEFLLIIFWGFLGMLGYVAVLYSLPNWATSLGFTENQGCILDAVLNLGVGLGRPIIGLISERWGRINIGMILTFLSGLFCLVIWIPANNFGVGIFFALVEGATCGTFWAVFAPVW
jgi:MFS family permease